MSQAISESGPPDRNGVVGWIAVSLVVPSRTAKIRSVSARIPSTRTPLTRPTVNTAASTQPNARAARRPIHRLSQPATHRKKWVIPRLAATNPTKTSTATNGSANFEPNDSALCTHQIADLPLPPLTQQVRGHHHDGTDDQEHPP